MQPPQFLLYREGDFFAPPGRQHRSDAPGFVRQRSVSAVVFLNGRREPTNYSGGSLTFYGLMDDGVGGESVGLPLAGETGLLVAFPSDLVHAVSPVTAGERYTVVTWFLRTGAPSVSERSQTATERPTEGVTPNFGSRRSCSPETYGPDVGCNREPSFPPSTSKPGRCVHRRSRRLISIACAGFMLRGLCAQPNSAFNGEFDSGSTSPVRGVRRGTHPIGTSSPPRGLAVLTPFVGLAHWVD